MMNAIDFSKWSKQQNNWLSIGNVLIHKGKRKVGKSLFAQQLMTAAATGRTWFDEYVGKIKTYGVFCEDNEEKLRHRKSAINEFYQLSMESPDLAHNVRLFPRIREYSLLMTFNDENRKSPDFLLLRTA